MNPNRLSVSFPIFALVLSLMLCLSFGEYLYLNHSNNNITGMTDRIMIYQNGVLVARGTDAIQFTGGIDSMLCQLFNLSFGCTQASNYWEQVYPLQIGSACQYWK